MNLNPGLHPSTADEHGWISCVGPKTRSFFSSEHSGKWLIYNEDQNAADKAWDLILELADTDDNFVIAKSSTIAFRHRFPSYVICVYTLNWNDLSNVMEMREKLRNIGFTAALRYKRDIDTMLGVTGEKEFYYED